MQPNLHPSADWQLQSEKAAEACRLSIIKSPNGWTGYLGADIINGSHRQEKTPGGDEKRRRRRRRRRRKSLSAQRRATRTQTANKNITTETRWRESQIILLFAVWQEGFGRRFLLWDQHLRVSFAERRCLQSAADYHPLYSLAGSRGR